MKRETQINVNAEKFSADLIDWFEKNKRELPWRENKDPYKIWVSEIMLQQTKVDTVIPYFHHFIEKFPTIKDLAAADEQEVLKAWEGLGYYSRARNLQSAVKEVALEYNSKVPDHVDALSSLKGVGPYTRGAILSIAYDKPEPAVDGNVMRVMSRVLNIAEDIAKQRTRKVFEDNIRAIIPADNPSSFNQGLMELGALICTPKAPACMLCPVQKHCQAFALGIQDELPVKTKAKKQKRIPYFAFVGTDDKGAVLIEQRPADGLLANLWQFPMVAKQQMDIEHAASWFRANYGLHVKVVRELSPIKHVFSHLVWQVEVYRIAILGGELTAQDAVLVSIPELDQYPLPVSHQKIKEQMICLT
ncbi:A/G-specific adenine glycosylase [Aquibacillus salsiterrae]|uniref:Adenine DNA glycosylase n=1 Tax=Aquibacillus salsiterrae TaxID=2950439 RepID=A0A9X3WGX8_9BACI|nr:A/G-specific adenine glycosylase [Aquibacillus salsiterrae]MDC3418200.1 A/G-specific adenine glycosylase [Aquibacillus salsiterrae]